jgi:CheY-like chemotaxis protein
MPTILYVEDNEDNVYMLVRRLRRHGFEVIVAADGAQGVETARGLRRLPGSLEAVLAELMADKVARNWFPNGFVEFYWAHKQGAIAAPAG